MSNRRVTKDVSDNIIAGAVLGEFPLNKNDRLVEYTAAESVTIKGSNVIPIRIGNSWFLLDTDVVLTSADLDTGSFTLGTDYYVYACDDNGTFKGVISAATTFPDGYNADTSRKIGGFHYGRVRLVDSNWIPQDATNGSYGSGWEDDVSLGIVPNSVWDLKHRPACSPEGMALVGHVWVDIYLASQDEAITLSNGKLAGGTAKSAYNATPLTGTEGLNWYHFNELAKRTGKRMLSMAEWLMAAEGSPQGNDGDNVNAWTYTSNSGRNPTGTVARAVSAYNICDCVGNIWEWINEFIVRWDGTQGWAWKDVMSGQGVGQLYMYDPTALVAVLMGGDWSHGAYAGSRCANLLNSPWNVCTGFGCRFACDPL